MRNMTAKQQAFCQEYIVDKNATQAAIRAGYSKKTASQIGEENLRKPVIKSEIARLSKQVFDRVEIEAEDVLRQMQRALADTLHRIDGVDHIEHRHGAGFVHQFETTAEAALAAYQTGATEGLQNLGEIAGGDLCAGGDRLGSMSGLGLAGQPDHGT